MRLRTLAVAASIPIAAAVAPVHAETGELSGIEHVVLLSVDGLHAVDVERFIESHPGSNLAHLAHHGIRYTSASTSKPSDSFPGVLALVTGGSPVSHGVFYDVSWDRTQFAPGNSSCSGVPGIQTTYDETIDKLVLDSRGFVIDQNVIDPANLPYGIKDGRCQPIYPHDFERDNTIFEVIKQHGGRTAWADKHAAYDLVNGPSGKGVDDLYTPEITNPAGNNGPAGTSIANAGSPYDGDYGLVNVGGTLTATTDATVSVLCTYDNDLRKVRAVVNEIKGFDHTGARHVGMPTITGMNFQVVSVGEKVSHNNTDDSCNAPRDPKYPGLEAKSTDAAVDPRLRGGYVDGSGTPSVPLAYALDKVDSALGQMLAALGEKLESTLFIVSAKHGQAPIDPKKTQKVGHFAGGGDPTTGQPALVNAAAAGDPIALAIQNAGENDDDIALLWFQQADKDAIPDLAAKAAQWIRDHGDPVQLPFEDLLAGDKLKLQYGDPAHDATTPDIIVTPPLGMIYTHSGKKNAEHGGVGIDDTNVALVVSNPRLRETVIKTPVRTAQVAPTILQSLGIDPAALDAVRIEHTTVLPGLSF